jgi:beta-glucanase (GH16 family)
MRLLLTCLLSLPLAFHATCINAATVSTTTGPELVTNGVFADGLRGWNAVTGKATLVPSTLRSGGRALVASGEVTQPLLATLLQPGSSYTLKLKGRNLAGSGAATVLRFRERNGGSYRSYRCSVTSSSWQECRIDFTAPAYVAQADLLIAPPAAGSLQVDSVSMTQRTAIPRTEPVTTTVGSYVPAGYTLIFNDEFNGTALNRSKWFTRYIYMNETADRLNDEQQRYADNGNHAVANGILSLVARKVRSDDPAGINYESGMIRSDFVFTHGYVEARVRMPGGRGVWPAFWLNSDVSDAGVIGWPPEIDGFEVVNNGVEDTMSMLHTGVIMPSGSAPAPYLQADSAFNTTWGYWRAPYSFADGWHTVGVEWTADSVSTFVDGKRIATRAYNWVLADGSAAGGAHILLNLAIGGQWAGRHGIDDSAFPQALQINWIRAYQRK